MQCLTLAAFPDNLARRADQLKAFTAQMNRKVTMPSGTLRTLNSIPIITAVRGGLHAATELTPEGNGTEQAEG